MRFFILSLLFFIASYVFWRYNIIDKKGGRENAWIRRVCFALALMFIAKASIIVIPLGEAGCATLVGYVMDPYIESGLHIVPPVYTIHRFNVKVQEETVRARFEEKSVAEKTAKEQEDVVHVISVDAVKLRFDATVRYRIHGERAGWILANVGDEAALKRISITPGIRSAIREGARQIEGMHVFGKEVERFRQAIISALKPDFEKYGAVLEEVLLRDTGLEQKITDAVNDKIAAKQQAEAMVYKVQGELMEAVRRYVQAQGINAFQRTVTESINPRLLAWKGLEAVEMLSKEPNKVFVILGDKTGLPFLYPPTIGEAAPQVSSGELEKAAAVIKEFQDITKDGELTPDEIEKLMQAAGINK